MQIQWHDIDPKTGKKRYLRAERFAGEWAFMWKLVRRGDWNRGLRPTRVMWDHVLDGLKRRYQRREGVEQEDIDQVARILKTWTDPIDWREELHTPAPAEGDLKAT